MSNVPGVREFLAVVAEILRGGCVENFVRGLCCAPRRILSGGTVGTEGAGG